jgi:hypothetical protein
MRLLLVFALLLFCLPAQADQYSCQSVDRSAVAYVNTDMIVSKLETGRRCSLSVDGATATGDRSQAFVGAFNNLHYALFEEGYPNLINADMLIAMFTAPFGPDSNNPRGDELVDAANETLDPEDIASLEACLTSFGEMLGPQYEYGEIRDFGEFKTRHTNCRVIVPDSDGDPRPGATIARDGALLLEFEFGDNQASLAIPANFLINSRDGNGTFN